MKVKVLDLPGKPGQKKIVIEKSINILSQHFFFQYFLNYKAEPILCVTVNVLFKMKKVSWNFKKFLVSQGRYMP